MGGISPITRALRNAGWLLGGKGAGAGFAILYLAVAARTLGTASFGIFALILTYGQAAANIVQFQSWQTVVRYGAMHMTVVSAGGLHRLLIFTSALDIAAAVIGAALAAFGVVLVGPLFGWSPVEQQEAALFSFSLVLGLRGTPTGVLRLFDRFDLAAYSETVLPTMRLIGAGIAYGFAPTVGGFLAAWAVAELITTAAMWTLAVRELRRQGDHQTFLVDPRGVVQENPNLWRFAWSTNLTSSINLVWQQLPILAVGWAAGASTAGAYRIAMQITSALSKPALSLGRSIYPEMSKLAVGGGASALAAIISQSARLAWVTSVIVVLLIAVAGELALELIGGEEYVFAYPFLLLLSVAAAIDLSGFWVEPALVAVGRPGRVLWMRALAAAVYVVLLFRMLELWGAVGAAAATVVASILVRGLLALQWERACATGDLQN